MIIWILIIVLAFLFYKWGTSTFDYFEKKGVSFNKPLFLVGCRLSMILNNESFVDFLNRIYNEFKDEKISGVFEFRYPAFVIRDPELIKRLTIKEFDNFTDRRMVMDEKVEPMFARTVFAMKGKTWKDMRSTLSPAFTGNKMRRMFKLVNQVASQMTSTVLKQFEAGVKNEIEFKEFSRKLTTNIIASTSFGLEINSLENPNNDFIRIAVKASNFANFKSILKLAGFFFSPKLMAFFKVRFFDDETHAFFNYAVKEIFKSREETGEVRHDMIDLLMQAKKGQLQHDSETKSEDVKNASFASVEEHDTGERKVKRDWSDDDITAQCFIFFFAGFETVSTAMTFLAYELVRNPDVQEKLRAEIDEVNDSLNGEELTYEHLQKMTYLDQVITEVLRMHPPVPMVDRVCTKTFVLDCDGKKIEFEPGRNFYIPIYSIHHDPKYYPNPDKFDPERFSDENRHNVNQDCYLSFGIGPRNCIGNRFALMEVKNLTYHLLLNFIFEATEKTQIPLKYVKNPVIYQIKGGLHIALIPRRKST